MINIDELKLSNKFLNILLQNIDTAVFIADENLRIHQFNDSFLRLFGQLGPSGPNLVDATFGAASGCINTFNEKKPCGETSACRFCLIKQSLLQTLTSQEPMEKQFFDRIFHIDGLPVQKYLEFTSRPVTFQDQKMVLVFVYDVTRIEISKIELEKKQKQIDIDLEKAGEVQKNLLPKNVPDIPSIRADWFFEPCLTVGGDIFNIYRENDSHVSAYMLDVCGHGVSGAMIAVTVKQFLDQLHVQGLEQGAPFSPEKILNLLEEEFPFERFDCYFTIAYVQLNVKTGHASYGCAGHVPPVIIGPKNKFEVLDRHGTIIGLGQEPPLSQYDTQLKSGDKIILYTDGLTDYFGEKGAAENKDHFYNSLMKRTACPADQIVKGVMADQKALRADRQIDDDISLLVIEYTGA